MNYNIIPTPDSKKLFKKLAKKYPSLKADLKRLLDSLSEYPTQGINLGHNLFKIRMAISSKGKGKSGDARVITYLVTDDKEIYLVYIYDKSQLENLTKDQLLQILEKVGVL